MSVPVSKHHCYPPPPPPPSSSHAVVDSSLPQSLKHIVSNAEYYGPSIFLPATEVTTVFIFHEPSQLSALQDNGLPSVVLNSIIHKQVRCMLVACLCT